MPVTIPDAAARAASRLVERRVQEMPGERLQALVLGDTQDEELEALITLRQALRGAAKRSRPLPSGNGVKSIAIGKHAYDYLMSHDLPAEARHALEQALPRKTLVGLSFKDDAQIKACIESLMAGTGEASDDLEMKRYDQAARRLNTLLESDDQLVA